jgi:WD40 repeat protein
MLITAGSDGYLYIWSEKKIIKKQHAHPKAAILCLYASKNSKILVSGGTDGKAIVWKLSASSTIQNIFEFSIYSQDS